MQFRKDNSASRSVAIDMTPMIDIVFQLLIFFLVTAQMAERTRADLDLPQESGEEAMENALAGLTINIEADGSIVVDEKRIDLVALDQLIEDAMAQAGGPDALKPLVRADRNCDAGRLNEILSCLGAKGLGAVRLATERSR